LHRLYGARMTSRRSLVENGEKMWPPSLIGSPAGRGGFLVIAGLAVSGAALAGASDARTGDAARPRVAVRPAVGIGQAVATLRGTVRSAARRTVTFRWEYGRGGCAGTPLHDASIPPGRSASEDGSPDCGRGPGIGCG
jgi:hypothetical protein